jgi:hypothetical protein
MAVCSEVVAYPYQTLKTFELFIHNNDTKEGNNNEISRFQINQFYTWDSKDIL